MTRYANVKMRKNLSKNYVRSAVLYENETRIIGKIDEKDTKSRKHGISLYFIRCFKNVVIYTLHSNLQGGSLSNDF